MLNLPWYNSEGVMFTGMLSAREGSDPNKRHAFDTTGSPARLVLDSPAYSYFLFPYVQNLLMFSKLQSSRIFCAKTPNVRCHN